MSDDITLIDPFDLQEDTTPLTEGDLPPEAFDCEADEPQEVGQDG